MNLFRLFAIFTRISVLNEVQYRVNFFVQLFQSFLAMAVGVAIIALVFNQTGNLNGWSQPELLAVLGVHILVRGFIMTSIQPNMERIITDIRDGTLDYALTRPADSQAIVSVREFRLWQLTDSLVGLGIIIWAGVLMHSVVTWQEAVMFIGALVLGSLIIYSFWLMLTTLAFWWVRNENLLELFQSFYGASRWPVGVYPDWMRLGLTFLVPVAFAVTVPAEALTGRLTGQNLLLAVGFALLSLLAARQVWKFGLKNYSGASA